MSFFKDLIPMVPTTKVVGYTLCAEKEINDMWDDNDNIPGLCPVCRNLINKIPNLKYKVAKSGSKDIMNTYDDYVIVSQKFKNFCDDNGYKDLEFIGLPLSLGYYVFFPKRIYKIDPIASNVNLYRYKECCSQYYDITFSNACKAKDNDVKGDDFICRSDYLLASGRCKSPLIIIGTETAKKMKKYGLKGLCIHNTYDTVSEEELKELSWKRSYNNRVWIRYKLRRRKRNNRNKAIAWAAVIVILAAVALLIWWLA